MKSEPSPTADPPAFRVLIVHHQQSDRTFIDSVLRQPGYDTVVAADGDEALRISEMRGPFDLLVTEAVIPGMRGDELARRLRGTDPGLRILYLTDSSARLFEERTQLSEEEAFIEKPLTAQGLLEAASLILVGHIPAPRAVRVSIPGGQVRFANRVAGLTSLSVTGLLLEDSEALVADSTWRLALELPSGTMHLTGRVVSCVPHEAVVSGAGTQQTYATAMAFVTPSVGVRRGLQRAVLEANRD